MRLTRDFFNRPTLEVARDLLGKHLVFGDREGRITEVEAYIGDGSDPACHAHRGKTERNQVMFGPPGHSYVYFIYGMYHCLNFVTEPEGVAAAVLIRGLDGEKLDGPGKLCREFNITKNHNGIDLCEDENFYVEDRGESPSEIEATPRIGIKEGKDLLWRFLLTSRG